MKEKDPTQGHALVPISTPPDSSAAAFSWPRETEKPPKVRNHSALGAAGGFLHQIQWALVVLLRAGREDPNSYIKLEHLDDIEIVTQDDGTVLIQVKSSISGRPPNVTDTSRDLWSTLEVWAHYVLTHPSSPARERFVLVTTAGCAPGSAAEAIKNDERLRALELLNSVARASSGKTNNESYGVWRSLTESQRLRIVNAIHIIDGTAPVAEVADVIARELHPSMPGDPQVEELRDSMLGWWIRRVARHIQNRSADTIEFEEAATAVKARIDSLSSSALPIEDAIRDYIHQLEDADETTTYVQQLRLIAATEPIIVQAIEDYFRAKTHLNKWIREDLFPPEKLAAYYAELVGRWKRRAAINFSKLPQDATEAQLQTVGQALYASISEQQHNISHERGEEWIMTGSYHDLSDQKRVGWHRDFAERLK